MPVYFTQSLVVAGFRLWPISVSQAVELFAQSISSPVVSVDSSHPVPRTTFSTDPRMAVQ